MSDQLEYAGFEASEFAENPDPRVPCVLLLDTSGSMAEVVDCYSQETGETGMQDGRLYNVVSGGTTRIDLLNEGLVTLKETLAADSLASRRAEIAIVTFGGTVTTVQDFVTAENFQPPRLQTSGSTPMGQAIFAGLDMIARRKATYRSAGVSYYRPWIFLITDGGPDHGDPWKSAAAQVKQGEASKSFAFFTVAVEGANMDVLAQISTRPPAKLKGVNFREMFLWLSQSMQAVSQSSPGDTVALPPPGWTEV
ncbi:vWA domain-containing protein [Planctomicrobium sp. SH668]|uniref:vWA domain-containing protein n=1 Tax=Planctomicrobium sp. SH668 TaxID=3448126 RepID=UPI003F5B29A5